MHILDPESKVMQALTFLADLLLLSIYFVVTCLPVVTIGASVTAMYSVLRQRDHIESSITAKYFRAFAVNWKNATVSWLIQLALTALLALDLYFLQFMSGGLVGLLRIISIVLLAFLSMTGALVYPQIARYENKLGRYWRNALLLFFPKMWMLLPNLLLFLMPEILLFFRPDIYLYCLALRLMLIIGFQFYLSSLLMGKLFEPFEENELKE